MAEGSRIVFQDDKGHTIRHLPGDNQLHFVNYPKKGQQFVLQVGFTQVLENSTVVLLATGQLQYTSHDGTATKIAKVPVGARENKMWCTRCADWNCGHHRDLAM